MTLVDFVSFVVLLTYKTARYEDWSLSEIREQFNVGMDWCEQDALDAAQAAGKSRPELTQRPLASSSDASTQNHVYEDLMALQRAGRNVTELFYEGIDIDAAVAQLQGVLDATYPQQPEAPAK